MGDVFTANDEVFALALLINKHKSYKFAIAKRDKHLRSNDKKPKKPFTSSVSGNKIGWNDHGLNTLETLTSEVEEWHKQEKSDSMEHKLMNEIRKASGCAIQRKR